MDDFWELTFLERSSCRARILQEPHSVSVLCFMFCRELVVVTDPLHLAEAHPGVQKHAGLHAQKRSPDNSQRWSRIPAGGPQAALQSQCRFISSDLFSSSSFFLNRTSSSHVEVLKYIVVNDFCFSGKQVWKVLQSPAGHFSSKWNWMYKSVHGCRSLVAMSWTGKNTHHNIHCVETLYTGWSPLSHIVLNTFVILFVKFNVITFFQRMASTHLSFSASSPSCLIWTARWPSWTFSPKQKRYEIFNNRGFVIFWYRLIMLNGKGVKWKVMWTIFIYTSGLGNVAHLTIL